MPDAKESLIPEALDVGAAFPEDAYCSITNRIVIISPFPQRIHELIRGLTSACYDVMVFHHGDPTLPVRLQADYLIADCTRTGGPDDYTWLESPELSGITVIRLVPEGTIPDAEARTLPWPVPMAQALAFVRSLAKTVPDSGAAAAASDTAAAPAMAPAERVLRLHGLQLDLKRHTAAVDDNRLDLTKTEFDLLRVLLEAEGSVLTRQELMDKVWGDDYYGGSNTVDVHVKTLRQKLNDDPKKPRYIATVRGIGYRAADV